MYSVLVLWPCCIMVEHKSSLCACLPSEPSHIPELLLDTAVPLSEEAPDGPAASRPQDLPEDLGDLQGQAGESPAIFSLAWLMMTVSCCMVTFFIYCLSSSSCHVMSHCRVQIKRNFTTNWLISANIFVLKRSHRSQVNLLRKKRMRSRGGKGSEEKDENEGKERKRKPERGSCRKDWNKRWYDVLIN